MRTNNYFKVLGRTFSFEDGDLRSTANAYTNAQQVRAELSMSDVPIAVWRKPSLSGPWSGAPVVGELMWPTLSLVRRGEA